ncbi:MAG: tetratricopeptide repeat protein [Chthoniobacterales bacterium]|nr:tetratricopeptide repeat protein [Chthoniobacterales bacterium]
MANAGDLERGLRDCNRALALEPQYAFGYARRGDVYRLRDELEKALRDVATALRLDPKLPRAHQLRGRVYDEKHEYRQALRCFSEAMRCDPDWVNPIIARAETYRETGNYRAALADFRRALMVEPRSARPHNSLAWFLATCPEGKYRDGNTAVREASIACTLTQWKDAGYLDTMAAACAESGDFAQAVKRGQEAVKSVPKGERKKSLESHLAVFRQGKPWRESH